MKTQMYLLGHVSIYAALLTASIAAVADEPRVKAAVVEALTENMGPAGLQSLRTPEEFQVAECKSGRGDCLTRPQAECVGIDSCLGRGQAACQEQAKNLPAPNQPALNNPNISPDLRARLEKGKSGSARAKYAQCLIQVTKTCREMHC